MLALPNLLPRRRQLSGRYGDNEGGVSNNNAPSKPSWFDDCWRNKKGCRDDNVTGGQHDDCCCSHIADGRIKDGRGGRKREVGFSNASGRCEECSHPAKVGEECARFGIGGECGRTVRQEPTTRRLLLLRHRGRTDEGRRGRTKKRGRL